MGEFTGSPAEQDASRTLIDELSDIERGLQLRDERTQQALDGAHPWSKLAAEKAIRELAATRLPFTSDDLYPRVGGPLACSPAVIGALFLAASKRGEIRATGYQRSSRPSSHGRAIRVWVGCGEAA